MYSVTQFLQDCITFAPLFLAWIAALSLICWSLALIAHSPALNAQMQACELHSLQLHILTLLFDCNGSIAVGNIAVALLLQAGTELEVEEEPEPAPYAKTLTLDRPW